MSHFYRFKCDIYMLTVPTSSNIQKCCYKNLTSFKLYYWSDIIQHHATSCYRVAKRVQHVARKRGKALDPASYRSFSYARRCQLTFPSSCLITIMLDDVACIWPGINTFSLCFIVECKRTSRQSAADWDGWSGGQETSIHHGSYKPTRWNKSVSRLIL